MNHKRLMLGAVALAAFTLPTSTIGAAPKPTMDITLNCQGEIVDVSVAGNGDWTPAHDLNSTLVGVPIAFGEFSGVFTPTGGVPQAFTEAPFAKKKVPRTRNLVIDCTYRVSGAFADGTFTGAGSVTLIVPRVH